jgi:pyruvate dehydrogenase E2 component (dihydrolipoamide acetyltransferase)
MEEGTVLQWLKSVGDEVAVGDELVEIETDKANMVFESDVAGTLTEIVAEEGATVPLGEVIARVGSPDEASGDGAEPPQDQSPGQEAEDADRDSSAVAAAAPARAHAADTPPDTTTTAPSDSEPAPDGAEASPPVPRDSQGDGAAAGDGAGERVKASPLARRIARERGVDLAGLSGSGPGGRIVKADVEGAEAAPAEAEAEPAAAAGRERPETAKGQTETVELTKLQQTVARRMAESKATAPHFYLQAEVDMSRAFAARARLKQSAPEGEVVPSFNDMVVKASALALRSHPRANGAYKDGRWELYGRVNVGIAVAAPGALVVATITDADRKGLVEIATESRELARKAREKTITPPELSGATFSVTNLGMYGVTNFHPVINIPQAAILAVGEIAERPVVKDGEITAARLMGVTLACDHRILYGADGAELLARIKALLEEPLGLAL